MKIYSITAAYVDPIDNSIDVWSINCYKTLDAAKSALDNYYQDLLANQPIDCGDYSDDCNQFTAYGADGFVWHYQIEEYDLDKIII